MAPIRKDIEIAGGEVRTFKSAQDMVRHVDVMRRRVMPGGMSYYRIRKLCKRAGIEVDKSTVKRFFEGGDSDTGEGVVGRALFENAFAILQAVCGEAGYELAIIPKVTPPEGVKSS